MNQTVTQDVRNWYRHREIKAVLDTPAPFYRLQVSADGSDVRSKHLNLTAEELGAVLQLLDHLGER